jgi:hypothetical protein
MNGLLKMKALLVLAMMLFVVVVNATEYDLPSCYRTVPVTCSFNQMTLDMCNAEGNERKFVFLISERIYIPGGNIYGSADGKATCVVKPIKGTDPAKYDVTIKKVTK